ncbi:MAG: hypothetical protein NZM04_04130 [Methylacidiphilales bacterium]|nr:hypothetical protein [Candidatus Methylacidiphilales bacterium]MDW8349877.1 hypothetical protein [Verrucomicrobiae bacterium]
MIVVAFAVPHEGELLAKQLSSARPLPGKLLGLQGFLFDRAVAVVYVGMGKKSAQETMERVLEILRPRCVIVSGYGGALTHHWGVGDVAVAKNFSTPEWLRQIGRSEAWREAVFYCSDTILATPEAREAVHREYGAQIVEMETEPIYRLCKKHGVPILAVRVVSDTSDDVLPIGALERAFVPKWTAGRVVRFLFYLMTHWGEVGPFMRFVGHLHEARRALTQFLQVVLQRYVPVDS